MLAHKQLLDLIEAALAAPAAVADGNIQRQRTRAMPASAAQQVSLRLVSSRGGALLDTIDWQTVVGIECLARAAGPGVTPDVAVADLLAAVHARVLGSVALAAAGYRIDPEYRIEWAQDELDERIGAAVSLYTVRHIGAVSNIETA